LQRQVPLNHHQQDWQASKEEILSLLAKAERLGTSYQPSWTEEEAPPPQSGTLNLPPPETRTRQFSSCESADNSVISQAMTLSIVRISAMEMKKFFLNYYYSRLWIIILLALLLLCVVARIFFYFFCLSSSYCYVEEDHKKKM
jgi:hypothetical protein